jgi:hypothetical protein
MTQQKTFKRRVRARMEKTGESYTAARRILLTASDGPDPASGPEPEAPAVELLVDDAKLADATGHPHAHWFAVIDGWDGLRLGHTEIARRLVADAGVPSWWAQTITVDYERARGLRAPGQRADGFYLSASKIVHVPVERLFEAWEDEALRERWLPGDRLRVRTATAPRSARYDFDGGTSRVLAGFDAVSEAKSRVGMTHERLPDRETTDALKAFWRERLGVLAALLKPA